MDLLNPYEITSVLLSRLVRLLRIAAGAFIVLCAGSAVASQSALWRPIVSTYTAKEVGADVMSWCMLQDSQGVLHFGADGLFSFDGDRWQKDPIPNSFAVRCLDFGSDGRIWAGAAHDVGWFRQEATGQWIFHSLLDHLSAADRNFGDTWGAFATDEGAIFVCADRVLFWDGADFKVVYRPGAGRMSGFRIGRDVYVCQRDQGLFRADEGRLDVVAPLSSNDSQLIMWGERQQDGHLDFVGSRGVYSLREKQFVFRASAVSDFIRANMLTSVLRIPGDGLVIGTLSNGIACFNPDGTLRWHLDKRNGLPTNEIFGLKLDREGGLWVTSSTAIFRVSYRKDTSVYTVADGWADERCFSIKRFDGKLAVATPNAIDLLDEAAGRLVPGPAVNGHAWKLLDSRYGLILARDRGISIESHGQFRRLLQSDVDGVALSSAAENPDSFWAGIGQSIYLVDIPTNAVRVVATDLPDQPISIAEQAHNILWFGTRSRGVRSVIIGKESTGHTVRLPHSPFESGMGEVVADDSGTVYAFHAEKALALLSNSASFTPIKHWPNRPVTSFIAAGSAVWVVHPPWKGMASCVARLTVENGEAEWTAVTMPGLTAIGDPGAIFVEPLSGNRWQVWVGGSTGLLRSVIPDGFAPQPPAAPIWRMISDEGAATEVGTLDNASLPYSSRDIALACAFPYFDERSDVTVQIKIEGMDRNWISLPPGGSRTLTTLRDGSYTVRARSLGPSGLATEAAPLRFQVEPPAWRSVPAFGAYALLVLLSGFGALRARTHALRRRNAELETLVKKGVAHAERASAAKTDFVARISHDLRNPLHSISGITLKLSETALNAEQRELVAALRDCSDYVTVLVDGVLDFAQIEAGKVELRPVLFSPSDALRSVCANLKWAPDSEKSDFVVRVAAEVPAQLFADPGRVQEVLINLASNAVKYAPGRIVLGAELVGAGPDTPGTLEFYVQDEGPGLSGDEIKLIFNKFERTSRARTKDGAGLGLAVAKQLAGLMGGSLGVESQIGKGARFYLRLPLGVAAPQPAELAPVHQFQSVLLVEDAQYSAWATEAVLARLGMTVTEVARTGQQAVDKFAAGSFDLVLLDHNLPDMDGLRVAQLIRQSERNGIHTTIIAVTAFTTPEERQACLNAGMDGFAGKPLTPARLTQALAEASATALVSGPVAIAPEVIKTGLEPAYLQYLSDGTPSGLGAQVDRYCDALNADFIQMRQADQLKDWAAMASLAHQMVAHARVVNAVTLAEAAERLRQSVRSNEQDRIAEDLHRVGDQIDYVIAQIREWPSVQSIA